MLIKIVFATIKRRKYSPNVKTVITISCLRTFYRVTFLIYFVVKLFFFFASHFSFKNVWKYILEREKNDNIKKTYKTESKILLHYTRFKSVYDEWLPCTQ